MIKPITPEGVVDKKLDTIPKEVIAAFNILISENWNGSHSTVYKDDIVDLVMKTKKLSEFKSTWLDIEPIYQKAGWIVEYYKPAYNESGRPYYIFTKKE